MEWAVANQGIADQQGDSLAKSLGITSRATPIIDKFIEIRQPGLPRKSLIGSGPELSKRMVMTVAVEDYISRYGGMQLQPPYWRRLHF